MAAAVTAKSSQYRRSPVRVFWVVTQRAGTLLTPPEGVLNTAYLLVPDQTLLVKAEIRFSVKVVSVGQITTQSETMPMD